MLPSALSLALERLYEQSDTSAIAREARALSARYQSAARQGASLVEDGAEAYCVSRMPATFEAIAFALSCLPGDAPASMIDAGAGPGTAAWAARAQWPELTDITLWEREEAMITLGRALGAPGQYRQVELTRPLPGRADLVVMAYALNEFPRDQALSLALRLWEASGQALVLVDPGTPGAYRRMMEVRQCLLEAGAHLAAPCPTEAPCPLFEEDWCHFGRRVVRTRLHRRLKGGALGYEDEKFTFLVFTRRPQPGPSRILRRPVHQKGMVRLTLCSPSGLKTVTVPRSRKEEFRRARDAAWGDGWTPAP